MRILVAHNRYKYAGGEDSVMRAEVDMLRSAGNDVELFEVDNKSIQGTVAKIVAAASLFHSYNPFRRIDELLRKFQPDVLHIHNWFPLLSPSVISAAGEVGVPVVQTLHNFRMLCANGVLYRNGKICEDCLGKAFPPRATGPGWYFSSTGRSALVSAAFSYLRFARTWNGVSIFLAL